MIKDIKRMLKDSDLEWSIRRSFLYEVYLNLFYTDYVKNREREVAFYRSIVKADKNALVFDIGSNNGDKADRFLRMGARVICIEPDSNCCSVLKERFKGRSSSIKILNKAVSDSIGRKSMYPHKENSAYNTLSEKWAIKFSEAGKAQKNVLIRKIDVKTVTIDHLVRVYGEPHYIKIDIEGHEINALRGLTSKVPVITFEINLPEFAEEGVQCINRLNAIDPISTFNFFTSCEDGLELLKNVDAQKFKEILRSSSLKYMEVLCQMSTSRRVKE